MEDERVKEIYRNLTPEQRIKTSMSLYWTARELRAAGLRRRHPDWSEEQIQKEVRDAFLCART